MPERTDELEGSVEAVAGTLVGKRRLAAEGKAQRRTATAARETPGLAKLAAGKPTGNERRHAAGAAQDTRGTAQRAG